MAIKARGTKPRRLDRRNPFDWDGYLYGYFSAFLDGKGETTRAKLLAGCVKTQEACGKTPDLARIRKSIADHVMHWKRGEYGLTIVESADRTLVCTHVQGVPWAEYIEGKVR
jgi:hypothetical protein